MKRLLPLLLLLVSSVVRADEPEQVFTLPLFKEGLHTRYSANVIPDGSLSEALNVLLDEDVDGVVVAARGRTKYNPTAISDGIATATVRGLWPFDATDGTRYFVAFSSQSFYKSTGDGLWTQIAGLNGFSLATDFDCTQTIGKLWCANGVVFFSWDGASTAAVAGAPIGSLVGKFRNRVLLSGISGSKGRVRGSGELDGTDWTVQIPGVSTTPFSIAFGGADDGEDVVCMMGAYQDAYIVGKRKSLWGLYGFGRTDFQVRELSREVGCIEQRSVKEKNNCLYWMSLRGIEKYCGASIVRISDPIRDQIDTIIAAAGNLKSATDSSQADFEAGNLTASGPGAPVSAVIAPGSLVPSSATLFDTDWAAGPVYTQNIDTGTAGQISLTSTTVRDEWGGATIAGRLAWAEIGGTGFFTLSSGRLAAVDTGVDLNDNIATSSVTYSTGSWKMTYSQTGTNSCSFSVVCWQMRFMVNSGGDYYALQLRDGAVSTDVNHRLAILKSISSVETSLTEVLVPINLGQSYDFQVHKTTDGRIFALVDGVFVSSTPAQTQVTDSVKFQLAASNHNGGATFFDNFYYYTYASSGTLRSRTFDTSFSTPTYGAFSSTFTTQQNIEGQVRFFTQVSADGTTWDALVASSDTMKPAVAQKRYVRYELGMVPMVSTKTPTITDISLTANTTAYFISQCRNPSTTITEWENFSCTQDLNGGELTYYISTGPTCHTVTRSTAVWTLQTNNTPIAVATAAYVAYRVLFGVDTDSDAPKVRDCTINWSAGASRPPVATSVYRDRYYLAYTSSTASGSANDHVLVLDKNDKWTLFDNHNCYSLSGYERKLYCGSSTSAGQVWMMDNGTDYDGTAILSRIRTKAFNFGVPERRKSFSRLYLDLEPSPDPTQTISLTGRYILERSSTTHSLGAVDLNEDQGSILTAKFPFPLASPISGRYLQLELESNGLASPWRLFSGRLYFSLLEPE